MADDEFTRALEAVLHDVRAQCAVRPRLREDEEDGLILHAPDGSGLGLTVPPPGVTPAERLASLAEQVQEWAVEALWSEGASAVWPHCPDHPDTHPLEAGVVEGTAVWACPKSGSVFARVGGLEGDARPRRRGARARRR
ncbi:hypothetical protein GCM10022233_86650 [Streptomyces shaanxiensis]|uniref:Rieske domain-containing protein n=1 Tax=Streptomyces shaanxiensis TaxID=653357 RepID=A0ABP7WJE1_9ACTN